MRYISNRDNFLRKIKSSEILEKMPYSEKEFKITESSGGYATNHGAGPFHNDIGWNDSLVGRFINHLIRKAKVLIGGLRMTGLIRRLKSQFDNILDEAVMMDVDDETKSMIAKISLYTFFWEIIEAVKAGVKSTILIEFCNNAITKLTELDDFDEKNSLNQELLKFLEFLKTIDPEEGISITDPEEEESEDDEESEEVGDESKEDIKETSKSLEYKYLLQNLKSISTIINKVATMKLGKEATKLVIKKHKTLPNETVNKIAQANNISVDVIWTKNANTKIDNKGTTLTQWIDKAQNSPANKTKKMVNGKETFINRDKNDIALPKDVLLLLEKDQFIGNRQVKDPKQLQQQQKVKDATKAGVISGGQTAKEIGFEDQHTREAFEKLKNAVNILTNKDFYSVTSKFIDDISQNTTGGNLDPNKIKTIKNLYNEINIYYRDNKSQLDSLSKAPLYKESVVELEKNIKSIAKKIAIFSVTIMKFDGENLSFSKDLNQAIKDFISSFKAIRKSEILDFGKSKKKEKDEEYDKQSFISNYSKFVQLIKEADEEDDGGSEFDEDEDVVDDDSRMASKPPTGSSMEKVQDFFDKNCKGIKSFTIDKTEIEKVKKNLEQIEKEKSSYIINGFDPIIEIVRLFNRAYKIYVHTVISKRKKTLSGDAAGPSPGTLMEYTPMGSGDGGPWRNNKLFNQWENAVFDILGNRKYQFIFNKDTKMRVPRVPNPKKAEDWELRDNAGANLRKFMTEILDGDALYSFGASGAKGAQAKLLEKYFGQPDETANETINKGVDDGFDENSKTNNKINESKITLKFKSVNAFGSLGQVFLVTGKNKDGADVRRVFFVLEGNQESKNPFILLSYNGFGPVAKFISQSGNFKYDKGDCKDDLKETQIQFNGKEYDKKITKIKTSISEVFKPNNKINIGYILSGNPKDIKSEEFTIKDIYFLTSDGEDWKSKLYNFSSDKIKDLKTSLKLTDHNSYLNQLNDSAVIKKI